MPEATETMHIAWLAETTPICPDLVLALLFAMPEATETMHTALLAETTPICPDLVSALLFAKRMLRVGAKT